MDHLDIECVHAAPAGHESVFSDYIAYIEKVIKNTLPSYYVDASPEQLPEAFAKLKKDLPLIDFSNPTEGPCSMQAVLISYADYTDGVGRFMCDICNRWLIPGKQIPIGISYSLRFRFKYDPSVDFFIYATVAQINDSQELQIVKRHIPKLENEIKTIIRSVIHARKTISSESIGIEHKRAFIEENLLSLLDRPKKDFDQSVYDMMHQFLIRVSSEHNFGKIKENFARLARKAPRQVDRDIFNEIQHYVLLFRDAFMAERSRYHLYRIISYKYLFRKTIAYSMRENPNRRYMPIKFLPASIENNQKVLGLIVGLNTLNESEVFEARHILAGVRTYMRDVDMVENSQIMDMRKDAQVRTCYLELIKKDKSAFTGKEIGLLRDKLPKELPSRIESITHQLFVHRNEEEVMRNIIILSRQLKFVKDIPQVIINFDKQTASSLCFTVILLRLLKPKSPTLKTLLEESSNRFTFYDYDVKIVGHLRKKYPKEANVFEIRLDKHLYLRDDNSIDLYRARQAVMLELVTLLGEVRDFNGGMISKQHEALTELRSLLNNSDSSNDFLLENFFYSTVPTYMQSVIPPLQYKHLFSKLIALANTPHASVPYIIDYQIDDDFCLIAIGSAQDSYKEPLTTAVEQLHIPGSELCATSVRIYDLSCVGYIYRISSPEEAKSLIEIIELALGKWAKNLKKPVDLISDTLFQLENKAPS